MWFWCNSPMAGWWWIFPVMAILFLLFIFLFMRRQGFSCCGTKTVPGAEPGGSPKGGTDRPAAKRMKDFVTNA